LWPFDLGFPENSFPGQDYSVHYGTFRLDDWSPGTCCTPTRLTIEWDADCNGDGIVDYGQILDGTLIDDNADGIPDICSPACDGPPAPGHAVDFNGGSTLVGIPDAPALKLTTQATIETWVKPRTLPGHGMRLLGQGDGLNYNTDRAFDFTLAPDSAGVWGAEFFFSTPPHWVSAQAFNTPDLVEVGKWTHLAATIDTQESLVRLFRNGLLISEQRLGLGGQSFAGALIKDSTKPLEIGGNSALDSIVNSHFDGQLDEVRFWNVARTPEQILADYRSAVPPGTPGLVAAYRFDEGGGVIAHDSSGRGLDGSLIGSPAWVPIDSGKPPFIDQSPVDTRACPGKNVTLTVGAQGPSLAFQWRRDGVPLEDGARVQGSRSATLTLIGAGESDSGMYDCVVLNSCGSATSASAALAVCVADLDCDGLVDLADFFQFFGCWALQERCADLDGYEGVDLGDFFAFFGDFDAGC
jgi:hypothetical protein